MNKCTNNKGNRGDGSLRRIQRIRLGSLKIAVFLFSITAIFYARGQGGLADLRIQVNEVISVASNQKKPMSGALVRIYLNKAWISSDTTASDGILHYSTLYPGVYTIVCTKAGFFRDSQAVQLQVDVNKEHVIDLINLNDYGKAVVVDRTRRERPKPPINIIGVAPPLTGAQLIERAGSPLDILGKSNPSLIRTGSGTSIRGSRWDANKSFVDGASDNGSGLNTLGTYSVGVSLGGVPANKGDFTGGSFDWVTRSASMNKIAAFEMISSWKLDPFGYNSIAGFASGPLWIKKYKEKYGTTLKMMKLGYVLNGQWNYMADAAPGATGVYQINDDSRRKLELAPLTYTPSGFVYSASFLKASDFTLLKAHPNSPQQSGNFYGKLEFRPNTSMNIVAFAKFNYSSGLAPSNSILNTNANPRSDSRALLTYIQLTQNLKTSKASGISGAYYTIRADYYNQFSQTRDAAHLDNIFDYGYIGSFKTYTDEVFSYSRQDNNPNREPKVVVDQFGRTVKLTNYWEQTNWKDTLITFEASDKNAIRAAYTQSVFDNYASRGFKIQNKNQIQSNLGLLNGYNPSQVYSLWAAPGTATSGWSKSSTERYSVFSQGQLTYMNPNHRTNAAYAHDLQFGFYYEQQIQRGYNLNANSLWQLMPQLMNTHLSQPDLAHPILSYDANGIFTDTIRYNRLVNYSEQSHFDRAFRDQLIANGAKDLYGNKIDEKSMVDVNSYSPGDFKLNMFNADELLNNGNGYVSYYGYDYLGNKTHKRPGIDDFLNNKNSRSVDAFRPVYSAAWLQDQFSFKDLVFRLGLRMERYDANQSVLADPWSLYPIQTASEVTTINGSQITHPSNIGKDFKVYVNDIKSPTQIVGYRNGDKWYNADGSEQSNPEFLANKTSNGQIAPLLVNPNQQNITASSFQDYKPSFNFLPRVWFSFPLVPDRQTFYISYDVLAQRPNSGASFLTMDELYYLKNRQGSTISNGQLAPRIRTNYEAGYKHIFGEKLNKGLEISTSYSEIRKDFGLYRVSQGYPVSYITYRNIDFSTITSFNASFVVNNLGPLSLFAGYMLQFADGTGSNINSQAALIASNQPNLRNVIPLGELDVRHSIKASATWTFISGYDKVNRKNLYNGPVVGNREILKNTTINITANAYSGLPYTPTTRPVQIGSADRAQVKGVPFGARMPWQQFVDINIAKNIKLGNLTTSPSLQIFLAVQNVFNIRNIAAVYPYTGSATDDGYLASAQGQLAVKNQISAQSYSDMYKMLLNSQSSNFNTPRVTRFGMRLFFNN